MSIWAVVVKLLNDLVPFIATALGTIITILLGRLALALGNNKYATTATDSAIEVVKALNAEIVDKAKSDGVFTKEEQALVCAEAVRRVRAMIGAIGIKALELAKVDLELLIQTKIIAAVETVKVERAAAGASAVNNTPQP